jgi:glycine betaine/proline transport system permease protein
LSALAIAARTARPWPIARTVWLSAAAISLAWPLLPRGTVPAWALELPRAWQWPLARQLGAWMRWLVDEASLGFITVKELTRGLAALLDWPLWLATSLLATGFMDGRGSAAAQLVPPLPWLAIAAFAALLGTLARDWRLGALAGGCFLYLAWFGQWASAMTTLASIAVAVPLGVAGGLLLGIAAYRRRWIERALEPVLDLMQTVPIFAYLVPVLFFFGFGPVAAMIATIVYAMPPMVRVTVLALRSVPEETVEYGRMAGCTVHQLTWRVLVPSARPLLMVGVNQVIMLSLNMVIIASMIGAGGLGYDVLSALRRLDIGAGLEAGLAIVVLAIALDRVSQALAERGRIASALAARFVLMALLLVGGAWLAGLAVPALVRWPEAWTLSTGPWWGELVAWVNVNYFDTLEAFKNAVVLNVMVPIRRLLTAQPWPWAMLLLALAGLRLGGPRLALLCTALPAFIVLTGQWQNAVLTVYLTAVSVLIAALLGIPIGIAAAGRPRLWRIVETVIDTLQTLPSFVYLIPVVMLFRVGDFTAMLAIVLYALAPAVRYTAHGLMQVPGQYLEAGLVSGCTPRQLLWRVRLPLALPQILLGVNQTIMLAISMLVITALVGTRDLGQEVYVALAKADIGRGLVAGLCVAFIAIVADRLVRAATRRAEVRLGLAPQGWRAAASPSATARAGP